MSLILEALRKMEQDRRSRRAAGDLRPEVLRYRGETAPQKSRPYLLVGAGLMLLLGGLAAGFLLKGQHATTVSAPSEKEPAPASAALIEAPPATVVVAPKAPAPPAAPALPASTASASPSIPPASRPAPAEAVSAPEVAASEDDQAEVQVAPKPKRVRKGASAAKPSVTPSARVSYAKRPGQNRGDELQPGIPDITISGIAWQDERNLRRAVLNGTLVGEGAEVAGARVVEIRENRVRLSRGGRLFDVVFSSGLSSR